ncbi:MAG: hypothetical protein H6573_12085 [Lewinellaceae bacterium]|nr:hypothetical protein [Phaeodactylibacter sp.]MCB0611700.1 hypothetical protein [Phaeodactylibacter sp.]MCB9348230.1 hypothetical protein [Lewinellaceae bacterium]
MKSKWNFFNRAKLSSLWMMLGMAACLILLANPLTAQDNKSAEQKWENFDPAKFDKNSIHITNEWMPLKPGMRYVYAGTTLSDEDEPLAHRVIINVTDLTKEINGVNCVVSWDLDYSGGELVEAELAFFAQDKEGNVWRMGEYPEEYEDGEFAEAPHWIAGIQDAIAGISMLANPWAGTPSYSQGWGPKVGFTDRGQVDEMGLSTCVPMGCYDNVMVIKETSEEEPGIFQLKYWARGVGNVQVGFKGDDPSAELLELVDVIQLKGDNLLEMREQALALEKAAYERKVNKKVYALTKPCVVRSEIKDKGKDMKMMKDKE